MAGELVRYFRDLGRYGRLALQEGRGRVPGLGRDWTAPGPHDDLAALVAAIHPKEMKLRVREIIDETPSTRTFRTTRIDGALPPFRAGQSVSLVVEIGGVRTSRSYSISSPPGAGHLDLTVKGPGGGFVAPWLLEQVAEGDVLTASGPAGGFYYEPLIDGQDLVFIAGGSGITPFMSMIRDLARRPSPPAVHVLYGSRRPDDVIFGAELEALAASKDWLQVDVVISDPPPGYEGATGLLDRERISSLLGDVAGRRFFLCGPGGLYELCLDALLELGVPRHMIRRELFGPPSDITAAPGWPVGVGADATFHIEIRGGERFEARATEPILNALERRGYRVPATCRAGECSSCRLRLLSGEVYMPPETGIRESDLVHRWIHSCVAYPISDIRVAL